MRKSISIRDSRIVVSGRIQTGSYTNSEGQKVYTTEVVVEEQEFAESKASSDSYAASHPSADCGAVYAESGRSKRRRLYEYSGWNRTKNCHSTKLKEIEEQEETIMAYNRG